MKVGDILIYLGENNNDRYKPYTKNKHYRIFKVDNSFGYIHGWIKDNYDGNVYFKESDATNEEWEYLGRLRKEKLLKIYNKK